MTRYDEDAADMTAVVPARLPRWVVEMAKDIGSRGKRRETVGGVVARLLAKSLPREHAKLPPLSAPKAKGN